MKFSDINENLTEAPEKFNAKQGLIKQARTKLKKKLAPTKKGREQAQIEDETRQQAKIIKSRFNKWMARTGGAGAKPSTEAFIEFVNDEQNNMTDLAPFVEPTAIKLNFHDKPKPKPQDIQKQVPTDDINYSVELDKSGAPVKDAESDKPKEPTDPTKKPEGMDQDEYDGIKDAYAKKFADDTDESVEEDADGAEPKVDMSASIYEARLNAFLLFEKEIKDNQLDTLIVRVIQAAAKGGRQDPEPEAKPEAKKDELGKTADKISNAKSDDSEEFRASSRGEGSVLDEYGEELESILTAVANGKEISSNQKGYARAILNEL